MSHVISALTSETLASLRAEAARHTSRFTDPALIRDAETTLAPVDAGWLERVVGRRTRGWRYLSNAELHLAVNAARVDGEYIASAAAVQRDAWLVADARREGAAALARQTAWNEWEALRARLPVPVVVCHNWTARHYDGYEQGADHIVVQAGLNVGRFHREAGRPLCWTPSRAHALRHVSGAPGDAERVPDCKACLRSAHRTAGPVEGG